VRVESREILTGPPPEPATARVDYGPEPLQFGDLRLPEGAGPFPVVVFVHGGFWQAIYNLTHAGHLCEALAAAGVASWNLEYRRIGDPGGGWPGSQEDVELGVAHLRELARDWPLDPARVVVAGHSAGGQLALCATRRANLGVQAVMSIAGVLDLREAWHRRLGGGVVGRYLGGGSEEVPERYAAASPVERLPIGVPVSLVHGTDDPSVPFDFGASYAEAAVAAGDEARLVPLEGAGHFEPVDPESAHWPTVLTELERLLG
jgi:acetyl esterase/lipase